MEAERSSAALEPLLVPTAAERAYPLLTLLDLIGGRDPSLVMHGESVGQFAVLTAECLGLPPSRVGHLRLAGILHDLGKLTVSESILNKSGPLSDEEWAEIRHHPAAGAQLIASVGLEEIAGWVLAHHERPDGLGYPRGLSGAEIPIEASILAVTDAYHAMVADRPYQASLSHAEATAELRRCAGTQFDEIVVDAAIRAVERDRRLLT